MHLVPNSISVASFQTVFFTWPVLGKAECQLKKQQLLCSPYLTLLQETDKYPTKLSLSGAAII